MPRVYIPAAQRAAHMALKHNTSADNARFETILARGHEIARRVFDGITSGTISEAHQTYNGGHTMSLYTLSTRPGVILQETWLTRGPHTGGDWEPSGHHDIYSPADIDIRHGRYITFTA